jgi:ankyrin repeat protein
MDDAPRRFGAAGDVVGLRAWLDAGDDVNQTDPATNQTLLMTAAHEGHRDLVRLLLDRGADRDEALFAAVLGQRGELARNGVLPRWELGRPA